MALVGATDHATSGLARRTESFPEHGMLRTVIACTPCQSSIFTRVNWLPSGRRRNRRKAVNSSVFLERQTSLTSQVSRTLKGPRLKRKATGQVGWDGIVMMREQAVAGLL